MPDKTIRSAIRQPAERIADKITKVKKRSGDLQKFDKDKIKKAVFKAITAAGEGDGVCSKKIADKVEELLNRRFKKNEIPSVEQIQDIVEEALILENLVETAKAYILYREQRRKIREVGVAFDESTELVDKYLKDSDWQVHENANMTYSLQGLNQYIIGAVAKKYWLNKIYPKEIREAAINEDFHIHDLESISTYCCGWDLHDLLERGFGGVPSKLECRPAKHFRTALGQLVNFFYTVQGEGAGAQAVSNFDTLMAPFIRYDNLNYQQTKKAVQEFLYNCMVPTRTGFQTPFINISIDIKPPKSLADHPVMIGGKFQEEKYEEFQEEMDMFNRAFYECMMEGDAKGRPFTFPIPTINITKDFPWEDKSLDPMWEATAKYGINYFANFVQGDMDPSEFRSMCLSPNEEILIRNSQNIKRLSIKEITENYKAEDFDQQGWAECKKQGNLNVLSLNPKTLKTEWAPVKRFLRAFDKKTIEITTEDGKKAAFSTKHPIPIFTENGIVMKWSKDVEKGDYLLSLKKAERSLSQKYQRIDEDLLLDEDLAKILGYFVADGNYLFENRKGYTFYGQPRGIQFTFKTGDTENLDLIRELIKKIFGREAKEKQDPRYNTYYLYVYNSNIARKLYNAGFKKYGRLPQILFNSPSQIIKNFLEYHFKGDGYEKRKEIHINDLELSRDLVLLYSLIGQPVTYKKRKNSQRIYIQHSRSKIKKNSGWLNNPIMSERAPAWIFKGIKIPGFAKTRMIGFNTMEKYGAETFNSLKLKNSDIFITRVKEIKQKTFKKAKEFFDLELAKNHLFIHSLGQISFNCCRLRLDNKELYKRGGGLFGSAPLTGSIGVVTINMPRIGYTSKTQKEFYAKLTDLMDLAKESLEIKRKAIENFMEKGLYPYSKYYLASIKKIRNGYFSNHFSTIGLLGMNEALLNFIGEDIGTKRGKKFALEILQFMRERLIKYQLETDNLYNLEATPAEGASFRQAEADKEKYPDIITAGTKQVPYYTNSSQLPVNYTDDLFKALELQDELQSSYTGGTVSHLFLGEQISDIQTVKNLVKKVFEKFHLPYITITPTFSICPTHGYLAGEHFFCPKCVIKQPCEVYTRIVGYLRPVSHFNVGKQQEFKERKTFKIK